MASDRIGAVIFFSALLISCIGFVSDMAGQEWILECVDCPKQFWEMSDRCMRFDASGFPHIAYGSDHLYYARFNGSEWIKEIAD